MSEENADFRSIADQLYYAAAWAEGLLAGDNWISRGCDGDPQRVLAHLRNAMSRYDEATGDEAEE